MTTHTAPNRHSGFNRTGGFTIAGIITGLAATAAALVLGVFVTTRLAQRGVRQTEAAIAGIKSSIAGSLDSLAAQDTSQADAEPVGMFQPPAPGPADCSGPPVEFTPTAAIVWDQPWVFPRRAWPFECWRRGFVMRSRMVRGRDVRLGRPGLLSGPFVVPGRAGRPSLP
jgi:hypothetical protein